MNNPSAPELLIQELSAQHGKIGLLIPNRGQALNAFTTQMCADMNAQLQVWEQRDDIHAVVIRSLHPTAFCAGGDVRQICQLGRQSPELAYEFFVQEYRLNRHIQRFTKPYIALLHGITMGGGLGVSIYGSHRVAAPGLRLAMPETIIGHYPDIGASYFLPRCPDQIGLYLGLVGTSIGAADAKALSLVDYIIAHEQFDAIIEALCAADLRSQADEQVSRILQRFAPASDQESLMPKRDLIRRHFTYESLDAIVTSLAGDQDPWSQETLQLLLSRSPTSLFVTFHAFKRGREMDFAACMDMGDHLTWRCLHGHDFYEGVRAALIDKDKKPRWKPATLAEVDEARLLQECFPDPI